MSQEITLWGVLFCLLLILPILFANHKLKLGLNKQTIISVLRMGVQLALAVFYLNVLFYYDNVFLNIGYILLMIAITTFSVISGAKFRIRPTFAAIFISLLLPVSLLLLYFNGLILALDNVFTARYLITIGGMVLGNSLKSVILSCEYVLTQVKKREVQYKNALCYGATKAEALSGFVKEGIKKALSPIIASMAATGIVALPGMTTGQILGGANPATAILYQFAILVVIFAVQYATALLSIWFMSRIAFDDYHMLKNEVFK